MGSALTVSLKSCRGEPTIKKGGGSCAPVRGVCLSQRLGVDIKKKSGSMLHLGGSSRSGKRWSTSRSGEVHVGARIHGWTEKYCNRN